MWTLTVTPDAVEDTDFYINIYSLYGKVGDSKICDCHWFGLCSLPVKKNNIVRCNHPHTPTNAHSLYKITNIHIH
jgi:hypothetical protein